MAAMTCERVRDLAAGYVLGALEPAEMASVRDHLDRCRKPHPELAELGGVLPYLADAVEPIEPPASLKSAILAAAQADVRARKRSDEAAERLVASIGTTKRARPARPATAPASEAEAAGAVTAAAGTAAAGDAAPVEEPSTRPVELPTSRPAELPEPVALPARKVDERPAAMVAGAAAQPARVPTPISTARSRRYRVIGLVASIAAAIAIVGLGVRVASLQNDLDQANHQLQVAQAKVDQLGGLFAPPEPGAQVVYLRSTKSDGPVGEAFLRQNSHVVLKMAKLAPTASPHVYMLWLTTPGGTSTKLASFAVDETGIAALTDLGPVQAQSGAVFQVTLESSDKASTPSSNVVAAGTVGS